MIMTRLDLRLSNFKGIPIKDFDHSGYAVVRTVVIINVVGRVVLNFLNIIHTQEDNTVEA